MTASDCYHLALMLYKQNDEVSYNSYTAEWFEAALEKLNNETDENVFTATDIMKYLVKTYHRLRISIGWLLIYFVNLLCPRILVFSNISALLLETIARRKTRK